MANSFALTDSGVVLQQPGQTIPGPQITLQGGGANAIPTATPGLAPDSGFQQIGEQLGDRAAKSINALNQMTQGALAPYVQEQQQKAYYEGMAQVAQGKALQDIKREQPWYSRIFGPSASVQGAQVMTAMNAIAQTESDITDAMPELRKKGPDEMRKFVGELFARIGDTGDTLTNGIIQQKLAEGIPKLLSTHMKQHFAWRQEDMGEKFVALQAANGKLLQSTLAQQSNFEKPEAMRREVQKFHEGLARPVGMTDEAYGQYMTLAAQAQLSGGNFAAYDAMKHNAEAWHAIPPKARLALENSEEKWNAQAKLNNPALFGITNDSALFQLAVKEGAFTGDESDLYALMDKFDEEYAMQTGSTTPFFNNAARNQIVQQYYQGKATAANAYAKIQQGAADYDAQVAAVWNAFNSGAPHLLPPGVSEAVLRETMEQIWAKALETPETLDNAISKLALISHARNLRVPSLETALRRDAQAVLTVGGNISEAQQGSLTLMQKFLTVTGGGPAALSNYLGGEEALKVKTFLDSGVDLKDPKALEEIRKLIKDGWGTHTTKEDKDAAKRYIASQDPLWYKVFTHGELDALELNGPTKQRMADELAPFVAKARKAYPGLDNEAAAQFAYHIMYGNPENVDFVAGTMVPRNSYMPGTQSLYSAVRQRAGFPVSQTAKNYQEALRDELHDILKWNVAQQVATANASGDKEHMAGMSRFRPGDYVAVGGQQMQGGNLTVYYRNKETHRTVPVVIEPEQVLGRLKANMARDHDLREASKPLVTDTAGGAAIVHRRPYRSTGD